MLKQFFSNHKQFALLYFTVLFIDVFVKLNCDPFPFRFMTKPWITILLIGYFYFNKVGDHRKKHKWMFLVLVSFLVGDLLNINHSNMLLLGLSLFFFSIGKIFLCFKFSHKNDFSVSRLMPFTGVMSVYSLVMIWFLYEHLGNFLAPALISFFLTLLMFQFAYLRQGVFNKKSYRYVFIGVLLYVLEESMLSVKLFMVLLPYQDFLIMLFYGTALYLIVFGIINQKEEEQELADEFSDDIKQSNPSEMP